MNWEVQLGVDVPGCHQRFFSETKAPEEWQRPIRPRMVAELYGYFLQRRKYAPVT